MQTEPTGAPVPRVIPARIRAHPSATAVEEQGHIVIEAAPPRRRNPLAKLASHLRGDKYMVGAYPPDEER